MITPTSGQIAKAKKKVLNLKIKFEKRFEIIFRSWQQLIYTDFILQKRNGASFVYISSNAKAELNEILNAHWKDVAMAFVPGLIFPDEIKQEEDDEEVEGFLLPSMLIPSALTAIRDRLSEQMFIQGKVHEKSILSTTEKLGNEATAIAGQQGSSYETVLNNKLKSHTKTVAITETTWIAEASMDTSLSVTTPLLRDANINELNGLQKISPNITLKNIDPESLFESSPAVINRTMVQLATPFKKWVDSGDSKVRATHAAINGTEIPVDVPFSLPGGLLMYPADSSLGVAIRETINCRCWAMYF